MPWPFEVLNVGSSEPAAMKRLIIQGDPGVRKGDRIAYDGQEVVCFGVSRQGEWHGPDRIQLWCTVGDPDEEETFERRQFIPMHLDVEEVDGGAVEIVEQGNELAV